MRDYGTENLIDLDHPTVISQPDPTYRNERQCMASEAGLGFIDRNYMDHNDLSGQWQVQFLFDEHECGDSYNSTKIEYFNLTDRPITVSNHEGVDTTVRHSKPDEFVGANFMKFHSGQKWFVIRRTEKIDLTAYCYKAGLDSSDMGTDNLKRMHHFQMRNNVNPPLATPYRQAILEFIRREFNRTEFTAESVWIQSFLFVRAEQLPEDKPMYVFAADVTLTQRRYLPVDNGSDHRFFELKRTKGGMDHPASPYAMRQSGKGVFSQVHKGSAGHGVRCRLIDSPNQENCVYWLSMGKILKIPVIPPRGLEEEGFYSTFQDPITGNVSEVNLGKDPEVLKNYGIFLHSVEATGKAAEFRSRFISEADAAQRLQEQEEKAKLATYVAEKEAEQKLEAAKAKAKATEDALRTDKIKLISVVIGAVASTFIALLGVIKLFTPSKSSIRSFLNFS